MTYLQCLTDPDDDRRKGAGFNQTGNQHLGTCVTNVINKVDHVFSVETSLITGKT